MKILLANSLLLTVAIACSEERIERTSAPTSRILFAQASPRMDPSKNVELYTADITLGNNNRKGDLAFGGVAVTNPSAGAVFIKTRLSNEPAPFLSGNLSAEPYGYYSSFLVNTDGASKELNAPVGITVLEDDLAPPPAGNVKVRVIHLGVGADPIDLYFYTGDTQTPPVATSLEYGTLFPGDYALALEPNAISAPRAAPFETLPAGTYNYRVRTAGAPSEDEPLLKGTAVLAEGRVYTILVRGYYQAPGAIQGRDLSVQTILHERLAY